MFTSDDDYNYEVIWSGIPEAWSVEVTNSFLKYCLQEEGSGDQDDEDDTEMDFNDEDFEVKPKEQVASTSSTTTASSAKIQVDITTIVNPTISSEDSTWIFVTMSSMWIK